MAQADLRADRAEQAVESSIRQLHLKSCRETCQGKGAVLIAGISGPLRTKPRERLKSARRHLAFECDLDQVQWPWHHNTVDSDVMRAHAKIDAPEVDPTGGLREQGLGVCPRQARRILGRLT